MQKQTKKKAQHFLRELSDLMDKEFGQTLHLKTDFVILNNLNKIEQNPELCFKNVFVIITVILDSLSCSSR